MNSKQKALLDSIPLKKHDPDGVTVKMVMEWRGCTWTHAGKLVQAKIARGEAVPCWVKEGDRFVKGMKLAGKG